jgi:hypothetical protein
MAGLRYSNIIKVIKNPDAWTTEIGRANASWGALENYTAMLAFFLPTLRTWIRELKAVKQAREDEERWDEAFGRDFENRRVHATGLKGLWYNIIKKEKWVKKQVPLKRIRHPHPPPPPPPSARFPVERLQCHEEAPVARRPAEHVPGKCAAFEIWGPTSTKGGFSDSVVIGVHEGDVSAYAGYCTTCVRREV